MGPGSNQATEADLKCAYEIGKIVASAGFVLLCGGMTGTMEQAAKGAKERNGLVVGIGPTMDKSDLNQYVDIPIMTGMNSGRNYINILSSDLVIFVGVASAGTLSELAFALKLNKPSIILMASEKLKAFIEEFGNRNVHFLESTTNLGQQLSDFLV